MWSKKFEAPYTNWISCRELFHPLDFKYFAAFLWACVDDPDAPSEVEFRERLARDCKLEPDAQGCPHPQVQQAGTLFYYFQEIFKLRPPGI